MIRANTILAGRLSVHPRIKTDMNIILNLLVVTVSVAVAASRVYDPCRGRSHGSHIYMFHDPLDCTKYYSCNGQIAHHMSCAAGTSFEQGYQHGYGSCTGPDPKQVPNCYQQSRSRIKSNILLKSVV